MVNRRRRERNLVITIVFAAVKVQIG